MEKTSSSSPRTFTSSSPSSVSSSPQVASQNGQVRKAVRATARPYDPVLARLCARGRAEMIGRMRLPWIIASVLSILLVARRRARRAVRSRARGRAVVVAWSVVRRAGAALGLLVATRAGATRSAGCCSRTARVLVLVGFADAYARYAVLGHPGSLPGGAGPSWSSDRAWPLHLRGRDGDRLGVPRRPAALLALAPVGDRGGAVVRGPDRVHGAGGRALQRPVRRRARPLPGAAGRRHRRAAGALRAGLDRRPRRRRRSRCGRGSGARSGIERQQLRWLAYAAALVPVAVAICLAGGGRHRRGRPGRAGGRHRRADGGADRGRRSRSCATGSTRSTG